MTCVAVMTLSGCTFVFSPNTKATTAPAQSKGTSQTSGSNDQLASWTDFRADDYLTSIAPTMGLQNLYTVKRRFVGQQFGDTYSFVGTYGPGCMVAISYDAKYKEKSIIHIPEQNVTILSRYNPVTFWYYRANVKIADTKTLLATQADNCR